MKHFKWQRSGRPVLGLIAIIWVVEALNWLLGHRLNTWGIEPRSLTGLVGIAAAPVLHSGWGHTLSNTFPLLVFGYLICLRSAGRFIRVSCLIVAGGGFAVWLLGRSAIHVGASGLVFGLFGYLLGCAWYERSGAAVVCAAVVGLLYGALIFGLLPSAGVSFESHIFGFLAGIALAKADGPRLRAQARR
ncbi:MAG: rhomboid family intramembrane serine protease [Gammaproteobacteria bacterium]|nr:rhomboid family intramembrane serine protease [Gammaproteobacteria bacterium]